MPGLGRTNKDGTCGAWTVVGGFPGAIHVRLATSESRALRQPLPSLALPAIREFSLLRFPMRDFRNGNR